MRHSPAPRRFPTLFIFHDQLPSPVFICVVPFLASFVSHTLRLLGFARLFLRPLAFLPSSAAPHALPSPSNPHAPSFLIMFVQATPAQAPSLPLSIPSPPLLPRAHLTSAHALQLLCRAHPAPSPLSASPLSNRTYRCLVHTDATLSFIHTRPRLRGGP